MSITIPAQGRPINRWVWDEGDAHVTAEGDYLFFLGHPPMAGVGALSGPTVVFSSRTVTPDAAAAVGSTTAPTVDSGAASVAPGAAAAIGSVTAPTVVVTGPLTADPISGIGHVTGPTISSGAALMATRITYAVDAEPRVFAAKIEPNVIAVDE